MPQILKRPEFAILVLTAALAAGCAIGISHVACVIGLRVPFDPNEGWNATFADMAIQTGSPYPSPGSYLADNYPPLSFYLIGALAKVFGDGIVVGRVVSLLSLVAAALSIETVLKRMDCTRWEALFGALFFVAAVLLTSDYAGMDDPQMLGHALSLAALALIVAAPRNRGSIVMASALSVLALFIKHNLVALPAALAVWLLLTDRPRGVLFTTSTVVLGTAALAAFHFAFGFSLLSHLASPRIYSLGNIENAAAAWLPWSALPLLAAATLAAVRRRNPFVAFAALYALVALAIGLALAGGDGVDANVFFDADIALALGAGLLFRELRGRQWQTILAAAAFSIPPFIGLRSLDADWQSEAYWLSPMADEARSSAQEIALIRSADGPVLCEMLSLCYWAGKPPEVDVFNTGEAFATSARSDRDLAERIAQRRYGLIELEANEPFPLTPRIHAALNRAYRIVRTDDDRAFYAPR